MVNLWAISVTCNCIVWAYLFGNCALGLKGYVFCLHPVNIGISQSSDLERKGVEGGGGLGAVMCHSEVQPFPSPLREEEEGGPQIRGNCTKSDSVAEATLCLVPESI